MRKTVKTAGGLGGAAAVLACAGLCLFPSIAAAATPKTDAGTQADVMGEWIPLTHAPTGLWEGNMSLAVGLKAPASIAVRTTKGVVGVLRNPGTSAHDGRITAVYAGRVDDATYRVSLIATPVSSGSGVPSYAAGEPIASIGTGLAGNLIPTGAGGWEGGVFADTVTDLKDLPTPILVRNGQQADLTAASPRQAGAESVDVAYTGSLADGEAFTFTVRYTQGARAGAGLQTTIVRNGETGSYQWDPDTGASLTQGGCPDAAKTASTASTGKTAGNANTPASGTANGSGTSTPAHATDSKPASNTPAGKPTDGTSGASGAHGDATGTSGSGATSPASKPADNTPQPAPTIVQPQPTVKPDTSLTGLTVVQTTPQGQSTPIAIPGFTPNQTSYTLLLPAAAAQDSYALNAQTGAQANLGQTSNRAGADGSRILAITVNGVTYTVHVRFQQAQAQQAGNPAILDNISVNGTPIPGFNPDVDSYTITAAGPNPRITWNAPTGARVVQSGLSESASKTTVRLTVTLDGRSRVYTITVNNPQARTAASVYTPPAAQAQTADTQASESDDQLQSAGYALNGKYHPQASDSWLIPDGGVFSYQAKKGQRVTIRETRVAGMTWRYLVTVSAPDGLTATHAYTVTYITPATHTALLTGIRINGTPIPGFNPRIRSYQAYVPDPEDWTILPIFDKTDGMSVVVDKRGARAAITVTSADGLVKTVYTVSVRRAAAGLAETGASQAGAATVGASLAALGIIIEQLKRKHL